MEVTEANFSVVLPEVKSAIASAAFLSIDTEFTGLSVKDSSSVYFHDSPTEAYAKLRSKAGFALIQFGLCTFHEDAEQPNKFTHRAYNFYILPCLREFVCQTDSITFLVKNGLNLNKVFGEGITNMKPSEQEAKIAFLHEKRDALLSPTSEPKSHSQITNIPEIHKEMIQKTREKITEFLADESQTELTLERFNKFQRLLLYQMVDAEFEGKAYMIFRVAEKRNRELVVLKGGEKDRQSKELEQLAKEEKSIKENSGFISVLSAIKDSGKLMVGHNMFLDILHTIHQFFEDAPMDVDSFKTLVHSKFPNIVDTKMLACKKPLKDKLESSALDSLVKTLSSQPFSMVDADVVEGAKGYSIKHDQAHEAGFDAYVTGLCFIEMTKLLSKETASFTETLETGILKPYKNKLLFAPFSEQGGYFNLCGADPKPSTEHIFHMTVPTEWNNSKIMELYSAYGGVSVQWIGKNECLVTLDKPSEAKRVRESLEKEVRDRKKNYTFQTLAKYKASSSKHNENGRRRRPSEGSTPSSAKKLKNNNGTSQDSPASRSKVFEEDASWD